MVFYTALFTLVFCSILPNSSLAAPNVGHITYISGEAWVERDGNKLATKRGEALQRKDIIVTGKRSRAKVVMNDGSSIYIGFRSRIEIKKYSLSGKKSLKTSFNMFWGKARFFVRKLRSPRSSFKVYTSNAVLGVRGTSFLVHQSIPKNVGKLQASGLNRNFEAFVQQVQIPTQVVLTTGLVDIKVSGQKTIALTAGHTATIDAKGVTKVRKNKSTSDLLPELQLQEGDASESNDSEQKTKDEKNKEQKNEPSAKEGTKNSETNKSDNNEKTGSPNTEPKLTMKIKELPEPPTLQQVNAISVIGNSGATSSLPSAKLNTNNNNTESSSNISAAVSNAKQNLGVVTDVKVQPLFVQP